MGRNKDTYNNCVKGTPAASVQWSAFCVRASEPRKSVDCSSRFTCLRKIWMSASGGMQKRNRALKALFNRCLTGSHHRRLHVASARQAGCGTALQQTPPCSKLTQLNLKNETSFNSLLKIFFQILPGGQLWPPSGALLTTTKEEAPSV